MSVVRQGVAVEVPREACNGGLALVAAAVPVSLTPGAFLAIVRDWSEVAPHPLLAELRRRCKSCGRSLGSHGADAPHAVTHGRLIRCAGFRS